MFGSATLAFRPEQLDLEDHNRLSCNRSNIRILQLLGPERLPHERHTSFGRRVHQHRACMTSIELVFGC